VNFLEPFALRAINSQAACETNCDIGNQMSMNSVKSVPLFIVVALATLPAIAADDFRTDINPALLYHQAFSITPELSPDDHQYLFTKDWRGRKLDERFGKLVSRYDNMFKLLRRAARAKVPCDWGIDLSDGPEAMLPQLARAKSATQAACLRARYALQQGKEAKRADDLIAAFVLGRNVSKDTILISALVQIAIENIVTSFIADNFYRFTPSRSRNWWQLSTRLQRAARSNSALQPRNAGSAIGSCARSRTSRRRILAARKRLSTTFANSAAATWGKRTQIPGLPRI
jgi:hypothetical protein